jgi:hypothetical protein
VKWPRGRATNWPRAFTGLNYLDRIFLSVRVRVDEWLYRFKMKVSAIKKFQITRYKYQTIGF